MNPKDSYEVIEKEDNFTVRLKAPLSTAPIIPTYLIKAIIRHHTSINGFNKALAVRDLWSYTNEKDKKWSLVEAVKAIDHFHDQMT